LGIVVKVGMIEFGALIRATITPSIMGEHLPAGIDEIWDLATPGMYRP
jgi:hypothetical protein